MRKEKLEELKKYCKELKTVKKEEINSNGNFITIKNFRVTLNDGTVIKRQQILKDGTDGSAVIVMPIIKDGEILTIVESRALLPQTVAVGFPAGYLGKNENIEEGVLRELREETGYIAEKLVLLDSFYQDEGCSSACIYSYLALGCEKKYPQKLDEGEALRYMTFTLEELEELESLGYIVSSNNKLTLDKGKALLRKNK